MADDNEEPPFATNLTPTSFHPAYQFGGDWTPNYPTTTINTTFTYEQTSFVYCARVEGSHKRRRIDNSIVSHGNQTSSSICATFQLHVNFESSDQRLLQNRVTVEENNDDESIARIEELASETDEVLPDAHEGSKGHVQSSAARGESNLTALSDLGLVCYGQLNDICQFRPSRATDNPDKVSWTGDNWLLVGNVRTPLSERTSEILTTLESTAGTEFEFCTTPVTESGRQCKLWPVPASKSLSVHVILYGLKDYAEDIGSWLEEIGLFLQVPTNCNRDVIYCNPHALSNPDAVTITTSQLEQLGPEVGVESVSATSLGCEDVFSHRLYEEAEQPSLMETTLKTHQLQALKFMQSRELGWDLCNDRGTDDLWRCQVDRRGRVQYSLALSSESRYKAPLEFKGGILADEMGLGKTCTMLSLIAAGLLEQQETQSSTLIVVPLPVLQVWEKQIALHFKPRTIVSTTYYKPYRGLKITFDSCDIVLTTYNTVSKEWKAYKKSSDAQNSPLFNTSWHRIVLDEAHVIKNKDTDLARAVSTLHGGRRWCMTGTPIQNRSSDIYSLLKFLRVYPYDDYRTFETTFIEPWTQRNDEQALRRFQSIMATITIRRPRTTVELPERIETFCDVSFDPEEMQMYERAKTCAFESINDAVNQEHGRTSGSAYLNALQRINDLRYICNHGTQPRARKSKPKMINNDDVLIEKELQSWMGESTQSAAMCDVCGYDLIEAQDSDELLNVQNHKKRLLSCPNCDSRLEISSLPAQAASPEPSQTTSSKIRKLISEVLQINYNDKCVIFSYWTSTLKCIARAFSDAGISFLTYDGSMSRTKRDNVLQKFKICPTVKAVLVSISCGGQGLDLTAANYAFMVEPQWNPMLEEQAMARIHRLGQKKAVKLIRMIVRGTWEENIVKLQKRKRLLADLIVDHKKVDKGEEAHRHLMQLRDLVS